MATHTATGRSHDRPVGYRPRSASRSAPADPMPARHAGKDDLVQALLEVAHFALCALALPSIAFLKATGEVFGIALRHIDVVVRQIAPLGMHLTLQLVPLARNHVFVHLLHPHSLARLIDVAPGMNASRAFVEGQQGVRGVEMSVNARNRSCVKLQNARSCY